MMEDDSTQWYYLLFNETHHGGMYRTPLLQVTTAQGFQASRHLAHDLECTGMAVWAIVPYKPTMSQTEASGRDRRDDTMTVKKPAQTIKPATVKKPSSKRPCLVCGKATSAPFGMHKSCALG